MLSGNGIRPRTDIVILETEFGGYIIAGAADLLSCDRPGHYRELPSRITLPSYQPSERRMHLLTGLETDAACLIWRFETTAERES